MTESVNVYKLPEIAWVPTKACGDRHGSKIQRVVLHRWGVRFTTEAAEAKVYNNVIDYFLDPSNDASAHFVYPGVAVPNKVTQMVAYSKYAWAQAAYNPTSVEIESADGIWLGHDPTGMGQLAHIVGFLLHHFDLPPVWSHDRGFCRHGDLGIAGGNHPGCPTLDLTVWKSFVKKVQIHYNRGGYRPTWGR